MALTLYVSSSFFNVVNFVLFDCFLCTLTFILTADIAGRFNTRSASSSNLENLSPRNPPILGIGLTSTKRHVFYVLIVIRLASFLFAFTTNFVFDGGTEQSIVYREASITVGGNLTYFESPNGIMKKVLRRRSCRNSKENTQYYGELRTFRGKTSCELNESRLQQKIYFDFAYKQHNLAFVRCGKSKLSYFRGFVCDDKELISCRSKRGAPESWADNCEDGDFKRYTCGRPLRQANGKYKFLCRFPKEISSRTMKAKVCKLYDSYYVFRIRCTNGIIGCSSLSETLISGGCYATANIDSTAYLCKNLTSIREPVSFNDELNKERISLNAACKKAKGVDWRLDSWIPYILRAIPSIEEAYDAMYASGSKKMKVPFVENQSITTVSIVWIILLGLQVAIIVGLATASCFLKSSGLSKVGNSERELGKLIIISEFLQQGREWRQEAFNLSKTELLVGLTNGQPSASIRKHVMQRKDVEGQEESDNLDHKFASQ